MSARTVDRKLSCLLIGDGSLLVQCGMLLLARGHRITGIVSANTDVGEWARSSDIDVIADGLGLSDRLTGVTYDWLFSINNLSLLPGKIWQAASRGAVNFHDGPLPRYAGLNAPAWALLAGETRYGVTWHAVSNVADEGDVYLQRAFDIDRHETALTLNTKCFEAGIASFTELVDLIENGTLTAHPQDLANRTYYGRHQRPSSAATLDFTRTADEITRVVRALTFGSGYINPLGLPKIRTEKGLYFVSGVETANVAAVGTPGTVLASDLSGVVVATGDGSICIEGLIDASGAAIDAQTVMRRDARILPNTSALQQAIDGFTNETVRHEAWFLKRLQAGNVPEIHGASPDGGLGVPDIQTFQLPVLSGWLEHRAVAAIAAFFIRSGTQTPIRLAYINDPCAADVEHLEGYVGTSLPLVIDVSEGATADGAVASSAVEIAALSERRGYPSDLLLRNPHALHQPATIAVRSTASIASSPSAAALTFVLPKDGMPAHLAVDVARVPASVLDALLDRLNTFISAFAADGSARIADLPVMTEAEKTVTIHGWNDTSVPYDRSAVVHRLIEAQAHRTPEAIAIVCDGRTLSYRELDRAANRVANVLTTKGVRPDQPIGLYLPRSCDLVIGALAILKAGGAYVALDPAYPRDRIAFMIEDSGLCFILSTDGLARSIGTSKTEVIRIEDAAASGAAEALPDVASATDLAYIMYTSGSTGRPKGVMVEHRNVVNLFAGMDSRIQRSSARQDVWLAVTSLSFDISVLEIFWTLARGFKVVVHTETRPVAPASSRARARAKSTDFSLFFWGNDDGVGARKYELLLDSSRFADSRGFRAVWTPERHFHAFGGPYPNPSVTGAAVAAVTKNVDVRAGSCVLPLHHPARVAEEWAVIDNLTNGRAGLAFASGWMPEDFVLRPENAPPENKLALLRDVETVRRLWRGEAVDFAGPDGKTVSVVTQPRPVSAELPVWITTAGNPETFREAARLGANVLTHLLGQSISEVGEKIAIYRQTLAETGRNPSDFTVTLMLHTLLGEDREVVREQARAPMKAYLRSAVMLVKQYAWAFPAFKRPRGVASAVDVDLRSLDPEELDAIIEFAFERYFDDSGLFGTVDDALARLEQVTAIGVDEIACLIDFGVPIPIAMGGLEPLAEVVAAASQGGLGVGAVSDFSVGGLICAHGVTHVQMTPSMAAMLLMDGDSRDTLRDIRHLYLGGEALPAALVRDLRSVTSATIENMYGPTETTVWSSTMTIGADVEGVAPLGTPIANTQLYILDSALRPVPRGQPGELFIGGDGVTRGYHGQPTLTAERFLPNLFTNTGRMYRTGDLVRRDDGDEIRFIGRVDHQVKVRGHRIELGEIEAQLASHPSVAEAVVVVREDKPNDARIVAYVRFKGEALSEEALRAHVRQTLPDHMMPAHFVSLAKFPQTPNRKVNRAFLPRPERTRAPQVVAERRSDGPVVGPAKDHADRIADAFKRTLGLDHIGFNDNFFSLGGHSLLAVQVMRDLKSSFAPNLSITDLYRFPTVAGLAAHINNRDAPNPLLGRVASRAAARRNALTARTIERKG